MVCALLWVHLMYVGGARVGISVIVGPRKADPWYSVLYYGSVLCTWVELE